MSTPVERVQEYLRQRKMQNKDLGNVIHGVFFDPNAEMADLTIDDLEAVLAQVPVRQPLDFPHLIEIRTETYAAGTHRVLTLINEYINSGAMAVVAVQAQELKS